MSSTQLIIGFIASNNARLRLQNSINSYQGSLKLVLYNKGSLSESFPLIIRSCKQPLLDSRYNQLLTCRYKVNLLTNKTVSKESSASPSIQL